MDSRLRDSSRDVVPVLNALLFSNLSWGTMDLVKYILGTFNLYEQAQCKVTFFLPLASFCFVLFLELHLTTLRASYRLCDQGSVLTGFRVWGSILGCWGFEPGPVNCKTSTLSTILTIQPWFIILRPRVGKFLEQFLRVKGEEPRKDRKDFLLNKELILSWASVICWVSLIFINGELFGKSIIRKNKSLTTPNRVTFQSFSLWVSRLALDMKADT